MIQGCCRIRSWLDNFLEGLKTKLQGALQDIKAEEQKKWIKNEYQQMKLIVPISERWQTLIRLLQPVIIVLYKAERKSHSLEQQCHTHTLISYCTYDSVNKYARARLIM